MKLSRRDFLKTLAVTVSASALPPILTGCDSRSDLFTPTATSTPTQTIPTVQPTSTPTAVQTAAPTATMSPTAVPLPVPTSTSTPTVCQVAAPAPMPPITPAFTVVQDEFTGAGKLIKHVPDLCPAGSRWNVLAGGWSIGDDGWVSSSAGDQGLAVIDSRAADVEINVDIGLKADQPGLCGRSNQDGSSRLMLWIDVEAMKITLAPFSSAGSQGDPIAVYPLDPGLFNPDPAIHALRWGMYGQTHRVYLNDQLVLVGESSLCQSNTFHGLGWLAGGGRWGRIEIQKTGYKRVTAIGDSITAGSDELAEPKWIYRAMHAWNAGRTSVSDRAIGGKRVLWDMQFQVRDAAKDDADIILIEIGTNDHVLLPEFQGEYGNELDKLKASNVRARIICMGILERTFDNTYRDAINDAIKHAALLRDCEYWDTTGWIDPTRGVDTVEGLHPNACGHQKIANRVLAKL